MIVSAAWAGPALLGAIDAVVQSRLEGMTPRLADVLFESLDWFAYALLTPGVFWFSNRFRFEPPHRFRNGVIHVAAAFLFCALWALAGTLIRLALHGGSDGHLLRGYVSWVFVTFPFGVSVYLSMAGIEHAIRWFETARVRAVQLATLEGQLATARFAALEAQLNPHFLFNTLNTLTVLVRDGNDRGAVRMIEQLSDLLRRTLGRHRASEVTLGEELDLVRQYLAIEEARFSDRLRPTIAVDADLFGAAIPGFALQHLVENAIRHGIARREGAGELRVTARRDGDLLEIVVLDDGAGITGGGIRAGHGLENSRGRLRALYGDRGTLTVERRGEVGSVATLRVPYRELPPEASDGPR